MVVFPLVSALISALCAAVIARDAARRPRPDKIAWTVAFALFALAAGAEVVGSLAEWTPALARVYYVSGAILVVGYLALGELYLLAGSRIGRFAPGAALLVTALAVTLVWGAPIDGGRLAEDGWEAIDRGPALVALAASVNGLGTLVIVGGLGYSAWRFRRLGIQRNRMIGCLLIALGTLTVAMGGTLTRFGQREYLYIAMSAGVAIIFTGYLWTRRPDGAGSRQPTADKRPAGVPRTDAPPSLAGDGRGALVSLPRIRADGGRLPAPPAGDPGVAFVDAKLLLDDAALAEECRVWSVPRREVDAFQRDEARRVWALRLRLSAEGQARFDALSVPTRLQLAELYHEVLSDEAASAPYAVRQR